MSTHISKLDIEGRERIRPSMEANTTVRPAAPKPREPLHQPADEPSTSYAAMLKEAYDGDTAEAMAVVANAKRPGEPQGEPRPPALEMPLKNKAAEPVLPIDRDARSAEFLKRLHGHRGDTVPVTAEQPTMQPPQALSAKQLHDQLMALSSKMDIPEIATHVAWRSFVRLTLILSQQNWMRQRSPA